ncbi:GTP-binding protein, putative [Plasmodium malariae]|uniref:GTP-binding protein, putative n=1 Tax=Plasmodium malariae TaxID=5858 RepID=A0A1A8VT95_PLAMA|nr:GTP-binding protein, putative [Plasmodium malariae]
MIYTVVNRRRSLLLRSSTASTASTSSSPSSLLLLSLCVFIFLLFLYNFDCACEAKWSIRENVYLIINCSGRRKNRGYFKKKDYLKSRQDKSYNVQKKYNNKDNDSNDSDNKYNNVVKKEAFALFYIKYFKLSLLLYNKGKKREKGKRYTINSYNSSYYIDNGTNLNEAKIGDKNNTQWGIEPHGSLSRWEKDDNNNTINKSSAKEMQACMEDVNKGDIITNMTNMTNMTNTANTANTIKVEQKNIRNFCILAHIDSGKSTLADRFLELTNTIKKKRMQDQYLDMMSLEREKGITIKLKAVRMSYHNYIFNLIDTPGHFDFYHEVKRSLNVCEGAILLIDGNKGIQSQTLNIFLELKKHNIKIIPVINKIDLNTCMYDKIKDDLIKKFYFKNEEILKISAKFGYHVKDLFQKIITDIPYPTINSNSFFRGIVFDSFFDKYKGVVLIIKVLNGNLKKKTEIFCINSEKSYIIQEVGYLVPEMKQTQEIKQGDIAYLCSNIRNCNDIQISETIINKDIVKLKGQKKTFVVNSKILNIGNLYANVKKEDTLLRCSDENYSNENSSSCKLVTQKFNDDEGEVKKIDLNNWCNKSLSDEKQKIFENGVQKNNVCVTTLDEDRTCTEETIKDGPSKKLDDFKEEKEINIKQIAATKVDVSYPSVYCNIYSVNDKKSNELHMALNKLKLNDSSFSFKIDICETLGKGFKCGFNGLLHLNIIQERIKREYNIETIVTAPSVNYLVRVKEKYIDKRLKQKLIEKNFDISNVHIDTRRGGNGTKGMDSGNEEMNRGEVEMDSGEEEMNRGEVEMDSGEEEMNRGEVEMDGCEDEDVDSTLKCVSGDGKNDFSEGLFFMTSNVNDIPQRNYVKCIYEPYVKTNIIAPVEYQKHILRECFNRRGIFIKKDIVNDQIIFFFEMPLSEILINFIDDIKSQTKGYGSMSYENYVIYKESDLYKINIYINHKCIDSLSFISHKLNYYEKARNIVLKLKNLINPHQFLIVIQAAVGTKVFVSEKIKPLKKNVTAKCYGGDITRRRKLIEKQNEGKKKMFNIGKVKLSPNIFTKLFDLKGN